MRISELSLRQKRILLERIMRGSSPKNALAVSTDPANKEHDWYVPAEDAPSVSAVRSWLKELGVVTAKSKPVAVAH